ncbi:AcrR family transcriptional regulator [Microbacterium sp. SORGH_AS 505]|uniref:TetR/AcrR family transcriptional regulator n=1 Tax=Microbacterium sp. SORGH_AS_0505 TaxID=3041770 RepID=UPI00277F8E08|nr:TetR/AcrR family transcriptional regulator [Microbacterium sp. SORGH_AS_0505]MDQ1125049.1 AcrR family transcriptional regulator [Microbacterium sp. SORGH_AS_0505]
MPRANLSPDALTRAALDLIDAGGPGALSMSALARRVGVQTASLYAHVRDLAALRSAVQAAVFTELADTIGESPTLRDLANTQRAYAFAHPARWAMISRPVEHNEITGPAASRISALVVGSLGDYALPASETVHAVRFASATIAGYLALEAADSFAHRDETTDASWNRALDALDRALRTWTPKDPA